MSQRRNNERTTKKGIFTSLHGCNVSEYSVYKNKRMKNLGNKM
jgi:hypothetical protein